MLPFLTLLLAFEPPRPPPSHDRYEAAVRLLQVRAPSEREQLSAIENGISHAVRAALVQGGIHAGYKRWSETYNLLMERLRSRIPAKQAAINAGITDCAARILGHNLSAEDLDAARRFMATPEGARVRAALRIGDDIVQHCYNEGVRYQIPLTNEDYDAAGLRLPQDRGGILS